MAIGAIWGEIWDEAIWDTAIWSQDAVQQVEVPDVTGQTQASATEEIEGVGLVVAVAEAFSDTVAVGLVISQEPVAGSMVNPGSTVTITVSLGAQKKRKGGGRAQRKRFVVEVDGQFVQVSTISEAQAVLAQARELAQESARRDVRPKVRIKPPRVAVRTVNGTIPTSPVINREAKRTQEFINRAYRDAQTSLERDLEIALLMRKAMQEEDDEEAVLALML